MTECRSLQTLAWTAAAARRYRRAGPCDGAAQYTGAYEEMPQAYRSGACVEGGALDLRPDDERFP